MNRPTARPRSEPRLSSRRNASSFAFPLTLFDERGFWATVYFTIRVAALTSLLVTVAHSSKAEPTASVREQVNLELQKPAGAFGSNPQIQRASREAKRALERADVAQRATDPKQQLTAPVIAETALQWAHWRTELITLAAFEAKVVAAEKQFQAAIAELKREQAHLEETEARRGRALAALEQLRKPPNGPVPPPTSNQTIPTPTHPAPPRANDRATLEQP